MLCERKPPRAARQTTAEVDERHASWLAYRDVPPRPSPRARHSRPPRARAFRAVMSTVARPLAAGVRAAGLSARAPGASRAVALSAATPRSAKAARLASRSTASRALVVRAADAEDAPAEAPAAAETPAPAAPLPRGPRRGEDRRGDGRDQGVPQAPVREARDELQRGALDPRHRGPSFGGPPRAVRHRGRERRERGREGGAAGADRRGRDPHGPARAGDAPRGFPRVARSRGGHRHGGERAAGPSRYAEIANQAAGIEHRARAEGSIRWRGRGGGCAEMDGNPFGFLVLYGVSAVPIFITIAALSIMFVAVAVTPGYRRRARLGVRRGEANFLSEVSSAL